LVFSIKKAKVYFPKGKEAYFGLLKQGEEVLLPMKTHITPGRPGFTSPKIGLGLLTTVLAGLLMGLLSANQGAAAPPAIGLSQFQQLYDYSDKAVIEQRASRSWTWGLVVSDLLTEPYTQGGVRKVQYFDKTRMEQTEGRAVTNGLLAKELITGLLQLGDNDFKQYQADYFHNIAGDPGSNVPNPTYLSFRKVATIDNDNKAPNKVGQTITATIARDGSVGDNADLGTQFKVKNAYFDNGLSHNIPDVFWNFLNQTGPVYKNGAYVNDKVFDWISTVGLPLTDAYWSKSVVGGKTLDVLVQAFERRVMTYTPTNNDPYKVEMGNVGQHYYAWRNLVTAPPPPTPTPTPPPANLEPVPAAPAWNGIARVVPSQSVLFASVMEVRPVDGVAYIMGEPGDPSKLLLTNSSNLNNFVNLQETQPNGSKRSHLSFGRDGAGYFVWRQFTDAAGYKAYMRKMTPDGNIQKGFDLSNAYRAAGGIADLDLPEVYASPATNKIYIAGQVKANNGATPAWGFAESDNGGASFYGAVNVAGPSKEDGEIKPRICTDKDDNIHMIGFWNHDVAAMSRINGKWTGIKILTDSNKLGFLFGGQLTIACGPDGYAYGVFKSVNQQNTGYSTGLVRYVPGEGWSLVAYDIYGLGVSSSFISNSINGTDGASITVTPDNRIWVASGINVGKYSGILVANSTNHGLNFGNLQVPISHLPTNQTVEIRYSTVNNKTRLHLMGTFKEPSERITLYTTTK
jgi:hypothetical protein